MKIWRLRQSRPMILVYYHYIRNRLVKISIMLFIAAVIISFGCLCVIINLNFVSEKPVAPLCIVYFFFFVLSLTAFGFSVEEKPGIVIGYQSSYTIYYINGIQVGSRSSSGPQIDGAVTIAGEMAAFTLFYFLMGMVNALNIVYAKEKIKAMPYGLMRKCLLFLLYCQISYLTLGILAAIYLSNEKSKRKRVRAGV